MFDLDVGPGSLIQITTEKSHRGDDILVLAVRWPNGGGFTKILHGIDYEGREVTLGESVILRVVEKEHGRQEGNKVQGEDLLT